MPKLIEKAKKIAAKKPAAKRTSSKKEKNVAPHKLSLLVLIVPTEKREFYEDFVQSCGVNACFAASARGTAPSEALSYLGIGDSGKAVIFSVIDQEKEKAALSSLEEKFQKIRGGKGVAFTVPLTSVIGVAIYKFLADKEK